MDYATRFSTARIEEEAREGQRLNTLFYAAARKPKQIWEVPGGQHIAGITTQAEEYERRVIGVSTTPYWTLNELPN